MGASLFPQHQSGLHPIYGLDFYLVTTQQMGLKLLKLTEMRSDFASLDMLAGSFKTPF
jgi:hypothetical protein